MDSNSLYNYKCILQKINHKPLILEKIFSFSENRPFILITLISRSALLKENLKTIFNNVKLNNNLSLELNDNIKKYINYRKSIEKLVELFNDSINRFNTQNIVNTLDNNFLNFKPDISKENNYSYLKNIFNVFESKIDMNKYIVFYIKLFRLENDINLLHNILLHIRHLSNYDYRHMKLIIEYLFDINCLGYLNLKIENYHDFYFKALENCIYEGNYEDDMINYVFYYLIFPMIKYSAQENNNDLFLEIIKLSMFYINNHVFLEKRKLDSPYIIFKENLKKISKNFFTENKQQFLSLIDNKNNSFLKEIFFDLLSKNNDTNRNDKNIDNNENTMNNNINVDNNYGKKDQDISNNINNGILKLSNNYNNDGITIEIDKKKEKNIMIIKTHIIVKIITTTTLEIIIIIEIIIITVIKIETLRINYLKIKAIIINLKIKRVIVKINLM